jgi:hypothetical protein
MTVAGSAALLLPLAALGGYLGGGKMALGVAMGGVMGLLNLLGMRRGLERFLGDGKSWGVLMLMGSGRLLLLMVAITVLALTRAINLGGFLAGYVAVLAVLIVAGLRTARSL